MDVVDSKPAEEPAPYKEADTGNEYFPCPACSGQGHVMLDKYHRAPCQKCGATGRRDVLRVGLDIVMVAHVRLRPCKCGAVVETPDQPLVQHARKGGELPPVECQRCGTILIARRSLILVPSVKS